MTPRDLPTGTVTFLFTDIEGSTRLVQELGDRFTDILLDHRAKLRDVFAFERALQDPAGTDPGRRALALRESGELMLFANQRSQAINRLEESVRVWRSLGDASEPFSRRRSRSARPPETETESVAASTSSVRSPETRATTTKG